TLRVVSRDNDRNENVVLRSARGMFGRLRGFRDRCGFGAGGRDGDDIEWLTGNKVVDAGELRLVCGGLPMLLKEQAGPGGGCGKGFADRPGEHFGGEVLDAMRP